MSRNTYNRILAEFKTRETPEAILVVGDDPCLMRIVLTWTNLKISQQEPTTDYSKQRSDVEKWEWLWKGVQFSKKDVQAVVGKQGIDAQVRYPIANRILYPDSTVHSYVVQYLRSQVAKLLYKKPTTRRNSTKLEI